MEMNLMDYLNNLKLFLELKKKLCKKTMKMIKNMI